MKKVITSLGIVLLGSTLAFAGQTGTTAPSASKPSVTVPASQPTSPVKTAKKHHGKRHHKKTSKVAPAQSQQSAPAKP